MLRKALASLNDVHKDDDQLSCISSITVEQWKFINVFFKPQIMKLKKLSGHQMSRNLKRMKHQMLTNEENDEDTFKPYRKHLSMFYNQLH